MRAWEHDEKLVASRQAKGQLMMGTDDIYYIQLPSKCQYLILCSFSLLCLFPGMPTQKVCNLVESYWFVFSAGNLMIESLCNEKNEGLGQFVRSVTVIFVKFPLLKSR